MSRAPFICDESGNETELPWRWEICRTCQGHGMSSAYLGSYTQSEMDEQGQDFRADYMAGHYDRACDTCEGAGKIKAVNEDRCRPADLQTYRDDVAFSREFAAETAAERRMGC